MKIKSQQYSIFYKNGKKWIGPYHELIFEKNEINHWFGSRTKKEGFKEYWGRELKKPIRLMNLVYENDRAN